MIGLFAPPRTFLRRLVASSVDVFPRLRHVLTIRTEAFNAVVKDILRNLKTPISRRPQQLNLSYRATQRP